MRCLAPLLALFLLLAGTPHGVHANAGHVPAHDFDLASSDGVHDPGAPEQPQGLHHDCAPVAGCSIGAALASASAFPPLGATSARIADGQHHDGIDTSPRPHPPKLSAAA